MSKKPKHCPKCQSKKVIPIIYGMPTEEAFEEAEKGKLMIGGCCVSDKSPQWYCADCQCEFSTILKNE